MEKNVNNKVKIGVCFIIIFLLLISVWRVYQGLHLDEMLFMAVGDMTHWKMKFFEESWIIFQFSGIFIAPFLSIYKKINGDLTGSIIYMRYIYYIIQIFVSLYAYQTLKRCYNKKIAAFIAIVSYLYYFNWRNITYKSLLYWFIWLCILCLINYGRTGGVKYIIIAAVCLSSSVISYPSSMVMLFPLMYIILKSSNERKKRDSLIFIGICGLCAMVLFGYSAVNGNIDGILYGIRMTLNTMDSHKESIWLKAARQIGMVLAFGILSYIPIGLFELVSSRIKKLKEARFLFLGLSAIAFFVVVCVLRIKTVTASRVWYTMLVIFLWTPYIMRHIGLDKTEKKNIFKYFILPTIFLMAAIIISTNQGVAIVSYGTVFGIFGILISLLKVKDINKTLVCFIAGLFLFCFVFFVPSQSGNCNIFWKSVPVDRGPAKGISTEEGIKELPV